MSRDTVHDLTRIIREKFTPDAARIEVLVRRSEDAQRAPYMETLLVYGPEGALRPPAYAWVQPHGIPLADPHEPHGIEDPETGAFFPTGSEDEYRAALADERALRSLNAYLIAELELAPYQEVNDWLCSGPGLVPEGHWVGLTLPEEPAGPSILGNGPDPLQISLTLGAHGQCSLNFGPGQPSFSLTVAEVLSLAAHLEYGAAGHFTDYRALACTLRCQGDPILLTQEDPSGETPDVDLALTPGQALQTADFLNSAARALYRTAYAGEHGPSTRTAVVTGRLPHAPFALA